LSSATRRTLRRARSRKKSRWDTTVYSDAALKVWRIQQRIVDSESETTKLTLEGYLYQWCNHAISTAEFVIVCANTDVDAYQVNVTDVAIEFVDADAALGRWNTYQEVTPHSDANKLILIDGTDYIPDGQATPGYVADVITLASGTDLDSVAGATGGPAYCMLHPEDWEGHFFELGGIPDMLPADNAAGRNFGQDAINELISYWITEQSNNDRWRDPETVGGSSENPGRTGEQPDFGAGAPAYLLASGRYAPWALDMAYAAAMREWIRAASHYREPNGDIIDWEDYPRFNARGEKRHGSTQYSPEKLGQSWITIDWARTTDMPEGENAHDIHPRNTEHFTANQLLATACITGSFLLYDRLRELGRIYARAYTGYPKSSEFRGLFMQLIDSGHRAEGRSRRVASRAYWLTGEGQIKRGIEQRIKSCAGEQAMNVQSWGDVWKYQVAGRGEYGGLANYKMFLLHLNQPYGGYFDNLALGIDELDRWIFIPWQMGLVIEGLHETIETFGDPDYDSEWGLFHQPLRMVVTRLAETQIRYGWVWNTADEEYFIAKGIRWPVANGDRAGLDMPVDHSLYQPGVDNDLQPWIQDDRGTAYKQWNWSGVRIALEHYLTDAADIEKATAIDAQLRATFEASTAEGFTGDTFQTAMRYGVSSTGQLG
jgi:hypothetical protein